VAQLTVLSWNVYHGRDRPPNDALRTLRSLLLRRPEHDDTHVHLNRPLRDEFASLIASAEWHVCLLQEAPPAWEAALAAAAGASSYVVLTSRNWGGRLRRRLADWNPDLMGSWEGGANITLVREPWRVGPSRALLLNRLPARRLRERRRMSFVRLHGTGGDVCVANLHLSAGLRPVAEREALAAAGAAVGWAGGTPLVLGGDFNVRPHTSAVFEELERRFGLVGPTDGKSLDHLLSRGLEVVRPPAAWPAARRELAAPVGLELRRLRLSDHAPVEAVFGLR
jgi:endonuclease/exonuclease/phosphatase family metal-dependent hydrolase